jgi:hypothetical protein
VGASTFVGRHAVVVGASMARLTATGAFADFFERVVVLEREGLPPDAAHPSATPQSRYLHALPAGGQRALAELFPGFEQDLPASGRYRFASRSIFVWRCRATIHSQSAILEGWSIPMSRPLISSGWYAGGFSSSATLSCGSVAASAMSLLRLTMRRSPWCAARMPMATARRSCRLVADPSERGNITLGLLEAIGPPLPKRRSSASISAMPRRSSQSATVAPADWKGLLLIPRVPETSCGAFLAPLEGGGRW